MKPRDIAIRLAIATLFCTAQGFAQQQQEPREGGDIIRQRMEWFYNQRAYPFKHIPAGARVRALQQMDQMLAEEARSAALSTDASPGFDSLAVASSTRWTLIGPQPTDTPYNDPVVAGRVTALAVDPINANVVYAGAAEGGVWKTTDGGVHWTPLTDTQPSLAVGSIAIDPSNHSTIYVGTGEENFSGDSYYGAGILKSINGGSSWTQIKGPFVGPFGNVTYDGGAYIGAIAVQPGNGSVILASVEMPLTPWGYIQTTLYRSEDGGATWTAVLPIWSPSLPPFHWGTGALFDPSNGDIAYAAISGPFNSCDACNSGVYKSLDGGKTWTQLSGTGSNVLPTTQLGRIVLAIAPSSPTTLYAGIQDTSTFGLLGLFKTGDGGSNWIKLGNTPNYCAPQCWYDQAIAVSPTNPNEVFVGGSAGSFVYRTMDGGSSWTDVTRGADGFYLHPDMHALAFSSDGSVLYAGNDGGVWRTNQPTATPVPWTELNDSLAITQFYFSPAIDHADVNDSLAGTQDNNTQKYNGTLTWNSVVCGDGGWTAIDPVTPNNVYSTCNRGSGLVWKSTTGGGPGSWSLAVSGITQSDGMGFLPPLAIDPLHPSHLYFGTYRVYQSTDRASGWTAISGDLTGNGGELTTIAVAPTDSNTVYAGTSDGWFGVTTNALAGAGAVWQTFYIEGVGNYPRFITDVAADPHVSTTVYITQSGFEGFNGAFAHVARSTDGGATWKDVSGNLPNIPVNGIAIDPRLANTYYVATDIGVFRTRNGGTKWYVLGAGLPRVTVMGVTLHDASRTLRAATHGRSMWDIHVPIADLAISSSESPNPVLHGGQLTYTLKVTNNGPDMAANTVISDSTPVSTTFTGFTASSGTCTAPAVGATGTLKCKIGSLANGATATVTLTVKDTANAGTTLIDRGSTSSATPDPDNKNNTTTVKTSVD